MRKNIDDLLAFLPKGWVMPLGWEVVAEQAREYEAAQKLTIKAMANKIKELQRVIEYLPSLEDLKDIEAQMIKLEKLQGRVGQKADCSNNFFD